MNTKQEKKKKTQITQLFGLAEEFRFRVVKFVFAQFMAFRLLNAE